MAKRPSKHGKSWSSTDVNELKRLARENTPTRVIGLKLGRTESAVRSKAGELALSLKPTNQSPYTRRPETSRTRAPKHATPKPKPRKGTRSRGPRAAKRK